MTRSGPNGLREEGATDTKTDRETRREQAPARQSGRQKRGAENGDLHRPRERRGPVYSAIDLGTNNCRLLIARPRREGFRVVDAFSRVVRLGEGVADSQQLSEAAMSRAIEALKVCADKIQRSQVTCMRHVATEACRVAGNAPEFLSRVKAETGINLDIISSREEAELAVTGCQSLITRGHRRALVFDIGGGSSELVWVKLNRKGVTRITGWISLPFGVVNLSEGYGNAGYDAMLQAVRPHLNAFNEAYNIADTMARERTLFLGTSGTVTTLASLHMGLQRYRRDKVDGAWLPPVEIAALTRRLSRMTHAERVAQPCVGQDRADLLVAGCAILDAMLCQWDVRSLRVADRGIREGLIRGMMATETPAFGAANRASARQKHLRRRKNSVPKKRDTTGVTA